MAAAEDAEESGRRERRHDDRAARAVALTAFLLLVAGVPFGVPLSTGVAGASVLLDGGRPYRDFWTLYAPGHFFLLAGLFAVFGKQLIVAALAAVVLEAVACALCFRLLRRVEVERRIAALAALVVAGVLFRAGPTLTTYAPVLVAALLAMLKTIDAAVSRAPRDAFAAGAWLGVAAWFKHDVAGYVAIAAVASLLVARTLRPESRRPWGAIALAAGAAATGLPMVLLIALTAGRAAWDDLIVFPLTDFAAARPEHYPGLNDVWRGGSGGGRRLELALQWIRHAAPLWIEVLLLVVVVRRHRRTTTPRLAAGVAALVALPLFFAAAHVQINTHILSMSSIVVMLAAVAWSDALRGAEVGRAAIAKTGTVAALAAASVVGLAALALEPARSAARALDLLRHGRAADVAGAWGIRVAPREAAELEGAAHAVREWTRDGDPIYVGVARHDAVVISRPELYLLLDRPCATRWAELHPGVVDREPVQRAIAADLERRGVRVLVLWHVGWPDSRFDEIRDRRRLLLPDTGATFLDEWIAARYAPVVRSGELEVLVRRDDS